MSKKAQSTIEFTFAVIVIVFLIYSMISVFRWAGMDLAQRRWAQDNAMTSGYDPAVQLNPDFYRVQSIDAIYHGKITGNEGP